MPLFRLLAARRQTRGGRPEAWHVSLAKLFAQHAARRDLGRWRRLLQSPTIFALGSSSVAVSKSSSCSIVRGPMIGAAPPGRQEARREPPAEQAARAGPQWPWRRPRPENYVAGSS
jgi:hypothetical protein